MKRALLMALGVWFSDSMHASAWAQDTYPRKPVKTVVGFTTGETPDVVARALAQKFSQQMRGHFLVESRTGSNGNVAAKFVARTPAKSS